MANKIQLRRDSATNWTNLNPVLSQGELGLELNYPTSPNDFKIGDGVTNWNDLPYSGVSSSGGVYGNSNVAAYLANYSGTIGNASHSVSSDSANSVAYANVTGKPTFATVATSGSYNDLSNTPSLSTVATSGSYNDLTNKPSLATVATSGSYTDLTNKPSIPDGTYANLTGKPSLATVATSGSYNDLTNKPNIPDGTYANLIGKPNFATVATSGSYTDLVNRPSLSTVSSTGNYSDLSGRPTLATVATSGDYNDLINKPSIPSISGLASTTYVDNKVANVTWANLSGAPSVPASLTDLSISDGSNGQVLTAYGNGHYHFTTVASGAAAGSNTQIQFNDNGNLNASSNLTYDKSSGQVYIATTTSSSITDGYHGALVLEGGIGAKGNIHMLHGIVHNQLYVGNNAGSTSFNNPTLIIKDTGIDYLQAAVVNANGDASADWVVYGDNGDDTQAWSDMGFTGSTFNDPNYTITKPNDGYFLVEGSGGLGGNMILATGGLSGYGDIIFATGGFSSSNEVLRINNSTKALQFAGNAMITSNNHTWTFDANGNIVLPSNTSAINYANGHSILSGLGGSGGILLSDLSVGTPNSPSGDGSLSYDNTSGIFTFTPPDLSGYVTGTPWTNEGYITGITGSDVTTALGYTPLQSSDLSSYVQSSSLATVATSGSYTDLSNLPTIPTDISQLSDSNHLLGTTYGDSNVESLLSNYSNNIESSGNIISGNITTGLLNVNAISLTGDIIPTADNTYDLGTPSNQFRHIYTANGSIYIGNIKLSNDNGNLSVQNVTNIGQQNESNVAVALKTDRLINISGKAAVLDNSSDDLVLPNGIKVGYVGDSSLQGGIGTGPGGLTLYGDTNKEVAIAVQPMSGPPKEWIFNTDGTVQFPDGTVQKTAFDYAPTKLMNLDGGFASTIYDIELLYVDCGGSFVRGILTEDTYDGATDGASRTQFTTYLNGGGA